MRLQRKENTEYFSKILDNLKESLILNIPPSDYSIPLHQHATYIAGEERN
jgi:hypothetical protein